MSEAAFKNSEIQRPDIFAYRDYKVYLRDFLHFLKLTDPQFSHRKLAAECGMSTGYLSTILNSKHQISQKAVQKLLPFLNLSKQESSYFEILCTIHEGADKEKRVESLQKLQKFDKFSKLNPMESKVSQYLSKWYYVAIRELANLPDFEMDTAWIHKKLNFSVAISEISTALEFLLQNKLIIITPQGKFAASEERVICEGNIFRFALTHFHKQMVNLAVDSIDNTKREHRNIRGHTICLSKEKYQLAKEVMDRALEEVEKLPGSTDKDLSVYHFLFLGYPLSKVGGGDNEN